MLFICFCSPKKMVKSARGIPVSIVIMAPYQVEALLQISKFDELSIHNQYQCKIIKDVTFSLGVRSV